VFTHFKTDDSQVLASSKDKNAIPIWLVSTNQFEEWEEELSKIQKKWVDVNKFKASRNETLLFSNADGKVAAVAVGLGSEEIDPWIISKCAEVVPNGTYFISNKLSEHQANIAAFGWAMAHYKYDHYLAKKNQKLAVLVVAENCALSYVNSLVRGTAFTRDLVNTPTCDMGPDKLEVEARQLAKYFDAKISVIKGSDLLKRNLNSIHTVGRAAEIEPRLIDIIWGDKKAPKVTLIGKGVCFDTGGLDIKPSSAMLIMKKDMGGAAHVLGLGQMIMEAGLNIRLRILIPAVENNIAGNAFRPGDIIKSYHGTTIEVGNTDAEGRLVLCDALSLASEEKPDLILDFATLTGAARVALGADIPPYFTDDENMKIQLAEQSKKHHDPLWPLPLYLPYKEHLLSDIADLNNVSPGGFGGAITAALFLQHFVSKNIPWTHFDVSAWNQNARPGRPKGGEAMGLRAVFGFLSQKYK
jgi:leucyl aminopeptidase